ARTPVKTLPELLRELIDSAEEASKKLAQDASQTPVLQYEQKRAEIQEMLRAMAAPPTKIYPGQLPLFLVVYRLEVGFDDGLRQRFDRRLNFEPIVWDSDMHRRKGQYQELEPEGLNRYYLLDDGQPGVYVKAKYHMHAFAQ